MKLTIVAATGGIGRQILPQAVAAGHDVTAVVRHPAKITADVRVVQADLSDPDPVPLAAAMDGADAVLSGLGGNSRADEDVAAGGTQAIVTAMKTAGARRIIVVSAAPIGTFRHPATRTRRSATPVTASSSATCWAPRSRPSSAGTTPISRGWRTCCAIAAWTGPWCGRRG